MRAAALLTLLVLSGRDGSAATARQRFHYAGAPRRTAYPNALKVLDSIGYEVGYDDVRKNPAWSSYRIFKIGSVKRLPRPARFTADDRTTSLVRHEDYAKTGYDRGHMTPNFAIASRFGGNAQLQTFLMSNVCPQKPRLNEQVWERLEDTEANRYANDFGEIWVVDGPIYADHPAALKSGVKIPKAFYKIILDDNHGKPRVLPFIMPQTVKGTEAPGRYLTSVRAIERATGLDFDADLDDATERTLEEQVPRAMW